MKKQYQTITLTIELLVRLIMKTEIKICKREIIFQKENFGVKWEKLNSPNIRLDRFTIKSHNFISCNKFINYNFLDLK